MLKPLSFLLSLTFPLTWCQSDFFSFLLSLPCHCMPRGSWTAGLTGCLRQLHAALRQLSLRDPRAAAEAP